MTVLVCLDHDRDSGVVNGEGGVASFGEGGFGAYEEEFCFITVELEEVVFIHVFIVERQDSMWVRGGLRRDLVPR